MANKQYSGPCLPSPAELIDLSITKKMLWQFLFKGEENRMRRIAIRDYRHAVRCKMFAQPNGRVTPWGVWEVEKKGLYQMHSSLNNRFIDTELAAPFVPMGDMEKIYTRMEEHEGILISESLPAREAVREEARRFLMGVLSARYKNQSFVRSDDVLIQALITPADKVKALEYANDTADRELVWACNQRYNCANHFIYALAGAKIRQIWREKPNAHEFVQLSVDDLIPKKIESNIHFATGSSQWFFINTETLAMLSQNFINNDKAREQAWLFFSSMASMAGLPCAIMSPHGHMDGTHPLSPANRRFDPIFAVLYGMWAMECADSFDIHLALDHPVRGLRGVYMGFRLTGKGRDAINDAKNEVGQLNVMLDHPNPDSAKPKGVLGDFAKSLEEA
jgi:hypothetical protein